jgi:dCTP deaminase
MGNNGGNGSKPSPVLLDRPGHTLAELASKKRSLKWRPQCSALSKPAILWHIARGNIFIHPFNPESLGPDSYDVRLGENFYMEQPLRAMDMGAFNPLDPECVKLLWGEPRKAVLAKDCKWWSRMKNIAPDRKIIILGPGEIILAHTQEFIGGRNCIYSEMRTKSTWGRTGINICRCAGLGHVGYCNRWTLEICNTYQDNPVILPVGVKIGQVTFHQVDPLNQRDSYARSGQYQTSDDMEKTMRDWAPEQMLPKFKDN